ncbi:MAG: transposase, partial [Gammaproteobacteria bacterium]|nr:transposase [Gammaproteobacteria bacterium]
GVLQYAPTPHREFRSPSQTIGSIVRGFKSAVTKQINHTRNTLGKPVWQRNYHERVLRNEIELNKIREYIQNNPIQWALDKKNPANMSE